MARIVGVFLSTKYINYIKRKFYLILLSKMFKIKFIYFRFIASVMSKVTAVMLNFASEEFLGCLNDTFYEGKILEKVEF